MAAIQPALLAPTEADPASTRVEHAITRVLAAEQAARAAIQACEQEAAALAQQSRDAARRIGARAARRSARVHDWAAATIATRLRHLEAERSRLYATAPAAADDAGRVAHAVQALAAALLAPEKAKP